MLVQQNKWYFWYIYIGPEHFGEWLYKQNKKNDVKMKYEVILSRTRIFWRNIKIKKNRTISLINFGPENSGIIWLLIMTRLFWRTIKLNKNIILTVSLGPEHSVLI